MDIQSLTEYLPKAQNYYEEVEDYYSSLSFEKAVEQAAEGTEPDFDNPKKLRFAPHQHRCGRKNCVYGGTKLLDQERVQKLKGAVTFLEILSVTDEVARMEETERLGPLWSYDTALRIGFHKGIYPKQVYLQCGSKEGANKLAEARIVNPSSIRKRHVSASVFPDEISKLKPYLIEHILCVGSGKGGSLLMNELKSPL